MMKINAAADDLGWGFAVARRQLGCPSDCIEGGHQTDVTRGVWYVRAQEAVTVERFTSLGSKEKENLIDVVTVPMEYALVGNIMSCIKAALSSPFEHWLGARRGVGYPIH